MSGKQPRTRCQLETYRPKPDDWHSVVFQPSLRNLLRRYDDGRRNDSVHRDSPYLFISSHNPQMGDGRISGIVKEAAENAGLLKETGETVDGRTQTWPRAHNLRHGHAIEALRSPEITLKDLQQQLGHHDVTITSEKYLIMLPAERAEAYQHFGQRGD